MIKTAPVISFASVPKGEGSLLRARSLLNSAFIALGHRAGLAHPGDRTMDNPRRSPLEAIYSQLAAAVQVLRDAREEADEAWQVTDEGDRRMSDDPDR